MRKVRLGLLGATIIALHVLPAGRALAQGTQEPPGPDTIVLQNRRGAVTLTHRKHAAQTQCSSCHHESKPEKPLAKARQKCSDCHTTPATEPVKTTLRMAFHDTQNNSGTCLSCHVKSNEAGKTAPVECSGCHKREGG
jgi:hypothetical protein